MYIDHCPSMVTCMHQINGWLELPNDHDVTKLAIIDVTGNSLVSGWNYEILTSIIAELLTSRPFGNLSQAGHIKFLVKSKMAAWQPYWILTHAIAQKTVLCSSGLKQ